MSRPTKITIDLNALRHNFGCVRSLTGGSSIIAMVKSNGYGHGLVRVAEALPETDAFGVACLEEGRLLRKAKIKNPVVLMEGLFDTTEINQAAAGNFTLVVHQFEQVTMLESISHLKNPLTIWLKIDTGMHRLGFSPSDARRAYQRLSNCVAVRKPIGFMTHFAQSEAEDKSFTTDQIKIFNEVTKDLIGPKSLANSGGIMAWPSSHQDWVRPGIILYGASPFVGRTGPNHGLKPVMSLSSSLIAIHDLQQGDRVGYGGTWTCPASMRVGVIAVGYGDGYPRNAENGTPILVNGKICPLVGRVSMDMITVDLRSQSTAKVGDPVLLWGDGVPVEKVAEFSGTTAYELLTGITRRVHVFESH